MAVQKTEKMSAVMDDLNIKRPTYGRLIDESKETSDSDHTWLISMIDVVTILLVFFVILFVITRGKEKDNPLQKVEKENIFMADISLKPLQFPQKRIPSPEPKEEEPIPDSIKIKEELESMVDTLHLENEIFIKTAQKEVLIIMKENVTFSSGKADILNESVPVLEKIAEIITEYPSFEVIIDGHTDSVPIHTSRFPSNWELSAARALGVLKYFINDHDIDPSRFSVKGSADRVPIVSNDTPEKRAQNRRVEIRLREA